MATIAGTARRPAGSSDSEMEVIATADAGQSGYGVHKKRKASKTELRETNDEALQDLVVSLRAVYRKLARSLRDTAFEFYEADNEDNLNDVGCAVDAIATYSEMVKEPSPAAGTGNRSQTDDDGCSHGHHAHAALVVPVVR